ncbi:hypothetical protein [Arthrobacter sp. UYEF3]|uniref:hypothetical protein n=1 Tax=Arthrobacter sp. UYEF3 TaxID=1756365 RepID=UPI003399F84A
MMTEKDEPIAAASGPGDPEKATPDAVKPNPAAPAPQAAGKAHPPKAHEHFVSPGAESTRELRDMARRRREAEEKLQQHLQEAKEKPADG